MSTKISFKIMIVRRRKPTIRSDTVAPHALGRKELYMCLVGSSKQGIVNSTTFHGYRSCVKNRQLSRISQAHLKADKKAHN